MGSAHREWRAEQFPCCCSRDEPSAGDRDQAPVKAELTGRQRARMADLSLLLDVILKTQSASAKQAICKNGILHQLQVNNLQQQCRTASYMFTSPCTSQAVNWPSAGLRGSMAACSCTFRCMYMHGDHSVQLGQEAKAI